MALNQPDEFVEVQRLLREIIPTVQRIRFDRKRLRQQQFIRAEAHPAGELYRSEITEYLSERMLFDTVSAPGVPADLASEGTLLVVGLLTGLMSSDHPRIVLLDDIDRGLHPKAQRELIRRLRDLLDRQPDLQIIATTHSPYIVSELAPEEVLITTLKDDGSTACARLDQHPEFERWATAMSPGEFWSSVGEKWVTQVTEPVG
jgi:predicted ATPase